MFIEGNTEFRVREAKNTLETIDSWLKASTRQLAEEALCRPRQLRTRINGIGPGPKWSHVDGRIVAPIAVG